MGLEAFTPGKTFCKCSPVSFHVHFIQGHTFHLFFFCFFLGFFVGLVFFSFLTIGGLTTDEQSYKCEGAIHHEIKCGERVLYQNAPWWKEKAESAYNENFLCFLQL